MKLLDGKTLAEKMYSRLEKEILDENIRPALGVLLVGDDASSHLYVGLKERVSARLGIRVEKKFLFESASQKQVEDVIEHFNQDNAIHGILVQLPLPAHISTDDIIGKIALEKDVDGFHPENEKRFIAGKPSFFSVFPRSILELIKLSGESLRGKNAVVVGNSWRFGNMMCVVLEREGIFSKHIPCIECSSEQGLKELKHADIVISACGKFRTITGVMLREGVILIDGGIVKDGGKIVGDVDRSSVEELEGWISPVPGGVGPVTIACLLSNVVRAAKTQRDKLKAENK